MERVTGQLTYVSEWLIRMRLIYMLCHMEKDNGEKNARLFWHCRYCNKYVDAYVLDATVKSLCENANMGCEHGCRLKAGSTTEVECFCNDGFELGTDGKTCSGKILVR